MNSVNSARKVGSAEVLVLWKAGCAMDIRWHSTEESASESFRTYYPTPPHAGRPLTPPIDPMGPTLTSPLATLGVAGTTPSLPVTPHVKLHKVSIKKFNRDMTKWVTFWDSVVSSIHSNTNASNVDKFNYLNSFLNRLPLNLSPDLQWLQQTTKRL